MLSKESCRTRCHGSTRSRESGVYVLFISVCNVNVSVEESTTWLFTFAVVPLQDALTRAIIPIPHFCQNGVSSVNLFPCRTEKCGYMI